MVKCNEREVDESQSVQMIITTNWKAHQTTIYNNMLKTVLDRVPVMHPKTV